MILVPQWTTAAERVRRDRPRRRNSSAGVARAPNQSREGRPGVRRQGRPTFPSRASDGAQLPRARPFHPSGGGPRGLREQARWLRARRHRETGWRGRRAGPGGSHTTPAVARPRSGRLLACLLLQLPGDRLRHKHATVEGPQEVHCSEQHKIIEGAGIGHDNHAGLSTFCFSRNSWTVARSFSKSS